MTIRKSSALRTVGRIARHGVGRSIGHGVGLALLLASSVALAVPPKYTKQESTIQAAAQTELTKPVTVKKEEKKRPTLEASDVFSGVGDQLKTVTDSQIKVQVFVGASTANRQFDAGAFTFVR